MGIWAYKLMNKYFQNIFFWFSYFSLSSYVKLVVSYKDQVWEILQVMFTDDLMTKVNLKGNKKRDFWPSERSHLMFNQKLISVFFFSSYTKFFFFGF